jgi:hypothetical protein
VAARVEEAEADPAAVATAGARARELAARYDWDEVAAGYERLAQRLAVRDLPRRRPSGRRRARGAPDPAATVASSASLTGRR